MKVWRALLGDDFVVRQRVSRIYYKGKFLSYPLRVGETLRAVGALESVRIVASFLAARLRPVHPERSFEDWVVNRFGRRLYEMFFRTYTEKVWGISCRELSADWAAQRIRAMTVWTVLKQAIFGRSGARSLITQFHYPRYGCGQMWETMLRRAADDGCRPMLHVRVEKFHVDGRRVRRAACSGPEGPVEVEAEHWISSVPLGRLPAMFDPPPPERVLEAAAGLRYRGLLEVVLMIRGDNPFPDQWIYVHSPEVRVGRVQNYKNWSPDMVPYEDVTVLGMEYFEWPGEGLWRLSDGQLLELGAREGEAIGLLRAADVIGGRVIRVPFAYPVYDPGYRERVAVIREWLEGLENFQTIGRAGLHRYNNMDHSMLTGLLAARNVLGESHDVWAVNEEQEYLEEKR